MDFINILSSAAGAPEITNWIGKILIWITESGIHFAWAVALFALLARTVLLPIDLWQKFATRKQQKAMARVQPQLEKLQKQFANQPELMREAQQKLYKKERVSVLSSCLPMILNLVVFIFVFQGFRAAVKYQNEMIVYNLYIEYKEIIASNTDTEIINAKLVEAYTGIYESHQWLWIDNIYRPDNWSSIIPTYEEFKSSGFGGVGGDLPPIMTSDYDGFNNYTTLFQPIINEYNKGWNGYLILPILSVATSFVSSKLMQATNKAAKKKRENMTQQEAQQQSTQKGMLFVMPIISGVFALFYSAAFSIYILAGNIFTSIVGLIFNLLTGRADKKHAELENTLALRSNKK